MGKWMNDESFGIKVQRLRERGAKNKMKVYKAEAKKHKKDTQVLPEFGALTKNRKKTVVKFKIKR